MIITLNNTKTELDQTSLSIAELIELKNYTFKMLVVKLNGQLVRKEQYIDTMVNDGDTVNILHLISGG